MVNRLSFRNLRIDNFKLITWLQIFIIAITPNFIFFQSANATTVAGEGWSVTKKLVQGATTFYDGTKNIVLNGKNYAATGAAKITPAASQVSKMIVRTGAVLAVDLAIKTLIGAVDYVMDPANNRVKYYVSPPTASPSDQYYWVNGNSQNIKYSSSRAALDGHLAYLCASGGTWGACPDQIKSISGPTALSYGVSYTVTRTNNSTVTYNMTKVANPAYDPNAQPNREEKYLPYDAVASQIISDAVAEKADGKAYVSSVADTALEQDEQRQIVPANDVIQQLTQSQAIPTSGTGTGTAVPAPTTGDPTTTPPADTPPYDLKLNFPVFCDWAPTVCQAAQVAINFPTTVAGYWTTFNKWMTESATDSTDTKPEVKELELNFDDGSRINFDQTCPQPLPIQVTFMGVTQDSSFSFEPLCNFMIMIRPFVIGSAYLIGAYIVMGLSRGNSE
ncbi:virulence factor TspB C-terminal domain-related protein [Acinetobacter baumannii]|uniref:virulence factor TspB C-terminal domain-related protein n=1 Tax=Acinetobacter baumannii TaxID=470 RepID=UPI0021CA8DBC|nr:virulence factor TspB C-terminal domain-related protein [Acinetobacter baumannii]